MATVAKIDSVSRSHVGRVRPINEDRVFADDASRCWAVADGMGGYAGGDVAAQSVVNELRALVAGGQPSASDLNAALSRANWAVCARNLDLGQQAGATIVAAVIEGDTLHIAWAGDSRVYRIRDGVSEQLTHDHSLVQELVDANLLSVEAAAQHPQANVVTRALGVDVKTKLDFTSSDLLPGDLFLLCSDGLSRSMTSELPPWPSTSDALADHLIGNALERDGTDNISLVLISCS